MNPLANASDSACQAWSARDEQTWGRKLLEPAGLLWALGELFIKTTGNCTAGLTYSCLTPLFCGI